MNLYECQCDSRATVLTLEDRVKYLEDVIECFREDIRKLEEVTGTLRVMPGGE